MMVRFARVVAICAGSLTLSFASSVLTFLLDMFIQSIFTGLSQLNTNNSLKTRLRKLSPSVFRTQMSCEGKAIH